MLGRNRKVDKLSLKEEKEYQVTTLFNSMSEKTHLRVVKYSVELDRLFYTLESLYSEKGVPVFHRYYFLKVLYSSPLQTLEGHLEKEMLLLGRKEHVLFRLERAVQARESCLHNLRRKLLELSEADVYEHLTLARYERDSHELKDYQKRYEGQGYHHIPQEHQDKDLFKSRLEDLFATVRHLHKLTVYVTDLVMAWREYLKSFTTDIRRKREGMVYRRGGDNLLLQMLNDNQFLASSLFASFYKFSPNDPFFFQPFLYTYAQPEPEPDDQSLLDLLIPDREDFVKIFRVFRVLADEFEMHLKKRKYHDVYERETKVTPY